MGAPPAPIFASKLVRLTRPCTVTLGTSALTAPLMPWTERSAFTAPSKCSSTWPLTPLTRMPRSDSCVIVIDTDPLKATEAGGHWWDVAVPEVSERSRVREAREGYDCGLKIAGYDDVKVDDVVEAYRVEQVQRTL